MLTCGLNRWWQQGGLLVGMALSLGGCSMPFSKPQYAALQVNSDPPAAVYIDGKHMGETKYYDQKLKPADHVVKLNLLNNTNDSWETKVKLSPGLTTIIERTFGATPPESGYYIVQLEKISNKKLAEISVVTVPENVIVRLDDQPKGFSPLNNVGVSAASHKVTLSAYGYKTQNINLNPTAGYRVLLYAELGKSPSLQPVAQATPSATLVPAASPTLTPKPSPSAKPTPSPKPSPTPKTSPTPKPTTAALPDPEKPYVEILNTPTGWLRVRSEPNGLAENEVAKVNSGEKYAFIESNNTGWYKIEYAPNQQGWVAAQYTKLVK